MDLVPSLTLEPSNTLFPSLCGLVPSLTLEPSDILIPCGDVPCRRLSPNFYY